MVVNVCPAAVTRAAPERVWSVLVDLERIEEWQGAKFVSATPPGPVLQGQRILLSARGLGRQWPVTIAVGAIDPQKRWIDFEVALPFGVVNHEHVTLTETPEGGTLVRLN